MIEKYILSKLSTTGRVLFWVIQLILDILLYIYFTRFSTLSFQSVQSGGVSYLILGIIASAIVAATITLIFFRKKETKEED